MSSQVDKLQGLLDKVQGNRGAPRASAEPAALAPPVARQSRASSPLEMAVAGELDRAQPVAAPLPLPPVQAAQVAQAVAPAAVPASPEGGVLVAEQNTREPGRPVAQVTSNHTPATTLSFGELLRRSLSLRPR